MKIVIGSTEYTALKNLRYSPSANIVSDRLVIDDFECDIVTDSDISAGSVANLMDGSTLWASGHVTYAEREDPKIVHIVAQSELIYLDRKKMPPKMYTGQTVQSAIEEIATTAGITILFNSSAVSGKTVRGFCDEMTCRERLQQILFVSGLYITSSFVAHPTVTNISNAVTATVPEELTFWRPKPTYEEDVTAVNVTAFSFAVGTPTSEDEHVTDGTTTWIVSRTTVTLRNPDVQVTAATNEVYIDDVMLVTEDNASSVVSLLGSYYFTRLKVEADIINNGEYAVGNTLGISMGEGYNSFASGFCESIDYSFGHQARSRVVIGSCTEVACPTLTVIYRRSASADYAEIDRKVFRLPEGMPYEITNPYLRKTMSGYEYVFRPTSETLTGTMGSTDETVYVTCAVALRLDLDTRVLTIISVDDFERTGRTEDSKTIYTLEIS